MLGEIVLWSAITLFLVGGSLLYLAFMDSLRRDVEDV